MQDTIRVKEKLATTNLFTLPDWPEMVDQSNQLIDHQNGILTFLIHPFFTEYVFQKPFDICNPKSVIQAIEKHKRTKRRRRRRRKITETISKLGTLDYYLRLQRLLSANISIICLGEPENLVSPTIAMIRELGFCGKILHYETCDADPIPRRSTGNWTLLAKSIDTLKFKKLMVAGQRNEYNVSKHSNIPQGCIPSFTANVRSRLPKKRRKDVNISPVVYPYWWSKNEEHPFFISK